MVYRKSRKRRVKRRSTRRRRAQGGGSSQTHTAIIIEPRKSKTEALTFVIHNVLENLGSQWNLIVFPGSENKGDVEKLIDRLPKKWKSRASMRDIGLDTMNEDAYNKLMMSDRILDEIPTEMFLVIQTDSLICKQGKDLIHQFMKYDYVGAPWKGRDAIGNGGFSLRRTRIMREILKKCSKLTNEGKPHNEDGFFSGGCEEVVPKKPSPKEAEKFSIETIDNGEKSFGIHKAWANFSDKIDVHEAQCLGYRTLRKLNSQNGGSEGAPLKIGIMGIFKNESMILKEWIDHYKWQGADHMVLLNNDSTDDWKAITDQYPDFVTVLDVPGKHIQMHAYNTAGIPKLKEKGMDVMVVTDLDEYYFGKDGRLLKDYINEIFTRPNRPSGYTCGWSMFGSNGHDKQPPSVREGFTMRWQENAEPENGISGKTTMLISELKDERLSCQHIPDLKGERISCPEGLQINHYPIMSREYYNKVKKPRGDVYTKHHNSARDDAYFTKYDNNKVEDKKLADQVKKFRENSATG